MQTNKSKISEDMEATKNNLSDKIEKIENHVKESIEDTKDRFSARVQEIKDATNIKHVVEKNPWWATGAAVFAGYAFSLYLSNKGSNKKHLIEKTNEAPSFMNKVVDEFKPEWTALKGALLQVAVKSLSSAAVKKFPKYEDEINQLRDNAYTKFNDPERTFH